MSVTDEQKQELINRVKAKLAAAWAEEPTYLIDGKTFHGDELLTIVTGKSTPSGAKNGVIPDYQYEVAAILDLETGQFVKGSAKPTKKGWKVKLHKVQKKNPPTILDYEVGYMGVVQDAGYPRRVEYVGENTGYSKFDPATGEMTVVKHSGGDQ